MEVGAGYWVKLGYVNDAATGSWEAWALALVQGLDSGCLEVPAPRRQHTGPRPCASDAPSPTPLSVGWVTAAVVQAGCHSVYTGRDPSASRTRCTTAASNPGPGTPPRLFLALSRCSAVREPPGLPLPSRVCVRLRGAGLGLWGIRQTRYARQARRGAPAQVGPRRRWSAPVGVRPCAGVVGSYRGHVRTSRRSCGTWQGSWRAGPSSGVL